MRSLKADKHFSGPARLMDSWLGKILYLRLNFPVTAIMPAAFGDKKKLTKEIHAHYKKALPDAASRIGAYPVGTNPEREGPTLCPSATALQAHGR